MKNPERSLRLLIYFAAVTAVIPVLPYIPSWLLLVLAGGLALGIGQDLTRSLPGGTLVATLVALAAAIDAFLRLRPDHVAEPIVGFLCVLLAVRLATEKTPRNIIQIFLLSTLILSASSLLSLNILFLVSLLGLFVLLSSGMILLHLSAATAEANCPHQGFAGIKRFFWIIPAGSVLLAAGLFVVLPRTPVPLWNIIGSESAALTGMTDQVRPGAFADLMSGSQVVFRAEMEVLPSEQLYWRGIVMDRLDGATWNRTLQVQQDVIRPNSSAIWPYTIYAEPKSDSYLVTLERTPRLQGLSYQAAGDGVFVRRVADRKQLTYRGEAYTVASVGYNGDGSHLLEVPDELVTARLVGVVESIREQAHKRSDRIRALEGFFLQQQLRYASRDLALTRSHVDTFLFETRRGYCEYFASSFAVMLRLLGVPSRLVGGYLGGDYNRFGRFYQVTEDRAHVWVEALDDEGYWRRIDPSRFAIDAEQTLLAARTPPNTWRYLEDALLYYWTRAVLNYDVRQQFSLARGAGDLLRQLLKPSLQLLWWLGAIMLLLLPLMLLYYRRKLLSSRHLVHRYRRRVARCAGLKQLPQELGLFQLAHLTGEPLCYEFSRIYGAAVYGDRTLGYAEGRRLRRIIRQLGKRRLRIGVAFTATLGDNEPSSPTILPERMKG